jgi:hypothetical protein
MTASVTGDLRTRVASGTIWLNFFLRAELSNFRANRDQAIEYCPAAGP